MKTKLATLLPVVFALAACAPAASLGGDVGLARAEVPRSSADPGDALQASATWALPAVAVKPAGAATACGRTSTCNVLML